MKKILRSIVRFRRRHLFVLPSEVEAVASAAKAVAACQMIEARDKYIQAAGALMNIKIHHRRSCKCYRVEVEVDSIVLWEDEQRGVDAVAHNVAERVREKHRAEIKTP